jgi:hypothetical protein
VWYISAASPVLAVLELTSIAQQNGEIITDFCKSYADLKSRVGDDHGRVSWSSDQCIIFCCANVDDISVTKIALGSSA